MSLSKKIFFANSSQSSRAVCKVKSFVNGSGAGSSSEAATSSPAGKTSSKDEAFASSAKSSQARAIARISTKASPSKDTTSTD
ncbi:MAG: hypothetical protein MUD14_22590 [Hydrococcus sp. Prado102]|nr:hypothetical protein [Hydrococcus sp. Prado102]